MRRPGDILPNQFPVVEPPGTARIALVGGAPSRDDDWHGSLFTGNPGALLDGALERCGLTRSQMFVGGVCQQRPPGDDFNRLAWDGSQVQEGIRRLRTDLEKFKPSIVVCLGQEALHLMKRGNVAPPRARGCFDWPDRIGDWRGSLFASDFLSGGDGVPNARDANSQIRVGVGAIVSDCGVSTLDSRLQTPRISTSVTKLAAPRSLKCLAAFHPSFVAKDYSQQAYYRCAPGIGDFERLRLEAGSPALDLPVRHIDVLFDLAEIKTRLERFRSERLPVAEDIEGKPGDITSMAFARNSQRATVIPFARINHARVWSKEDEALIWSWIRVVQEDVSVLKIGQWFSYDCFCIEWTWEIPTLGEVHSIEEMFWELFAELDKGLDVQASLLTKQPFYKPDKEKGELKFASDQEFWNYNGLDAVVTMECWERMWDLLGGRKAEALVAGSVPREPAASGEERAASKSSRLQPEGAM